MGRVMGCCSSTEEYWTRNREPGFESALLSFQSLDIFVLSTMLQFTQLCK